MKCNEAVEFGECAYEFQSNSSAVGFNGLSICAPQKIWLRVLQLGPEKGLALRLLLTARSAVSKSEFEHPLKAYLSKDIQVPKEKADLVGEKVAEVTVSITTKLRNLFLVDDLSDSLKLLVVLYILSYIALWFSGITLSFIGFIGAFIVPKIYDMYQTEIDSCMRKIKSAVDEVLQKITAKVPATKQKEASTPDSKDNLEHSDNDKKMS